MMVHTRSRGGLLAAQISEPSLLFVLPNRGQSGNHVCSDPGSGSGSGWGWGAALRQHSPASGRQRCGVLQHHTCSTAQAEAGRQRWRDWVQLCDDCCKAKVDGDSLHCLQHSITIKTVMEQFGNSFSLCRCPENEDDSSGLYSMLSKDLMNIWCKRFVPSGFSNIQRSNKDFIHLSTSVKLRPN